MKDSEFSDSIEKVRDQTDIIQVIIPPITIIRMIELTGKDYPIVLALYCFYYLTARRQKTNQPWASDSYCMNGLGWSGGRFYKAKKLLLQHRFIEIVKKSRNANGTFGKTYVKVCYMSNGRHNQKNYGTEKQDNGKSNTNTYRQEVKVLKDKRKKSKSKPSSQAKEPDPTKRFTSLKLKKIPEEEYKYLTEQPFAFSKKTIQNLLYEIEKGFDGYTLHDYSTWWKKSYHDKGKESDAFAVIYSAIKNGWELNSYYDWGLEQI